jgi:hypothetical protein
MLAVIHSRGFQECLLVSGSVTCVGVRAVAGFVAQFPRKSNMGPDGLSDGKDPQRSGEGV